MNYYAHDLSPLLDLGVSGSLFEAFNSNATVLPSDSAGEASTSADSQKTKQSPPRHRHDGTSPLPLGMDWSPPPRKGDGRDSIWPHDPRTGWSYCVTIPSWVILPSSRGSDPVVFYRVVVGIQSPEAVTTTRGVLRRFSDFLKFFYELKKSFPKKSFSSAPPRKLLRIKSSTFLEERRCSLEDWLEKLLSDIDISRSYPVANFLDLEAAARSSFGDASIIDAESSQQNRSVDISFAASSSVASDCGDYDSAYEKSEIGTPRRGRHSVYDLSRENSASDIDLSSAVAAATTVTFDMPGRVNTLPVGDFLETVRKFSMDKLLPGRANNTTEKRNAHEAKDEASLFFKNGKDYLSEAENVKADIHAHRLSADSAGSDTNSARASEISNLVISTYADDSFDIAEDSEATSTADINSMLRLPSDLVVALPSDVRHKFSRVFFTMKRRLVTAKTDMEDLVARLNQEVAVRQYLMTKVKDLEVELETSKENSKESLQQAVASERERFTQMQWDVEELKKKCLEMELKLKTEQDEKVRLQLSSLSIVEENEMLMQELDAARDKLETLQKDHEEFELKSKADTKVLVKEIKSQRTSQYELKQELSRIMKEKLEVERVLQKEKQKREQENSANAKLLHECEILRNRLQECSVNFFIEEEDKLVMDTSSPFDAIDLLTTSDNRIGLLLAEAQLLAQDVENSLAAKGSPGGYRNVTRSPEDEVRKMLTDIFIDNATLRKKINSVIRCTISVPDNIGEEEEVPSRKTVLSKFL